MLLQKEIEMRESCHVRDIMLAFVQQLIFSANSLYDLRFETYERE
jgi:hypothetical protein